MDRYRERNDSVTSSYRCHIIIQCNIIIKKNRLIDKRGTGAGKKKWKRGKLSIQGTRKNWRTRTVSVPAQRSFPPPPLLHDAEKQKKNGKGGEKKDR
jgi:hypothetical protein